MRRRRSVSDGEMPPELLVFNGFRYRTERTWRAGFDKFLAARQAWAQEHGGAVPAPPEVNGHCPFDWSRFEKSGS